MRRSIHALLLAGAGTASLLLPAAMPASAAEPRIEFVPGAIAADGSDDVGAELSTWLRTEMQEAVAAAQPLTVKFAPNGTYRINDASVFMSGAANLTLDFQGATLERTRVIDQALRWPSPNRNGFLRLDRPTDVTVRNLKVLGVNNNDGSMIRHSDAPVGATPYLLDRNGGRHEIVDNSLADGQWGIYNKALAFEHAVDITDGRNVVVHDARLVGMGGDGVNIIGEATDGVIIHKVTQRRNGRQGVAISAGRNILVDGNDLMSVRSGVDIEPDHAEQVLRNIEIRNNRIRSHLLAFASGGPGEIHGVNIHHNVVLESGVPVLFARSNGARQRRTGYKFNDNTVTEVLGSPQPLVQFGNVHNSEVMRNVIARASGSCSHTAVGLTMRPSTGIKVEGNTFAGAKPVVQDVAGGSIWTESGNDTGPSPAVPLIAGNVLSHQGQDFENSSAPCWQPMKEEPPLRRVSGGAHGSAGALELTVPGKLTGFALPGMTTDIATGPDRAVSLQGAVKADNAAASLYVVHQFFDADDNPIGSAVSAPVRGAATVGVWSTFTSSSVRTPTGTAKVRVSVGVASNTAGHRYRFDHLAAFSTP